MKITKRKTLNFLVLSLLVLVVIVLSFADDTLRLWMICSVLASVILPTLVNLTFLIKEENKQRLMAVSSYSPRLSHWIVHRWKYLFLDSELILIGIILGLDTIGDLAGTIVGMVNTSDGGNIPGGPTFLLFFLALTEFFVILIMTLTYGIHTKETFFSVMNQPPSRGNGISEIYTDQLITIFALIFQQPLISRIYPKYSSKLLVPSIYSFFLLSTVKLWNRLRSPL
ncbi:MAG: hypothetical protein AAFP07_14360 [Cyanobacteria bacterium J06606_4]